MLDFISLSEDLEGGYEGDCKYGREIQDACADFDHLQICVAARSTEKPPFALDEWGKADQEPAYKEYIRAPRITMHKSWDVDMISSHVDDFVAAAYAEDQHELGNLNTIIGRAMREAAHRQRVRREVTRGEKVKGLAEALRARNEEPNREKRKVLSRESAKRRRRGRREGLCESLAGIDRALGRATAADGLLDEASLPPP